MLRCEDETVGGGSVCVVFFIFYYYLITGALGTVQSCSKNVPMVRIQLSVAAFVERLHYWLKGVTFGKIPETRETQGLVSSCLQT